MNVLYLRSFVKDLKKFKDQKVQDKIKEIISNIKETENFEDINIVKRLKGYDNAYRIRIGKYRLGFFFEENTITFVHFLKREDIYKIFP